MKKKYIQLPRGYLSNSQAELWSRNPDMYVKIYMDGRDELRSNNAAMEYGKAVATALEENHETGDLLTDSAMLLLPKYDVRDQQFDVDVKTKYGWLKLVAKPDTFNPVTHEFREYKTGAYPWTQAKAQYHPQMWFYAAAIYLKYKTLLPGAWLDWIETETLHGEVMPTGHVDSFRVEFSLPGILQKIADLTRIAREIETVFVTHVPKPEIPW